MQRTRRRALATIAALALVAGCGSGDSGSARGEVLVSAATSVT